MQENMDYKESTLEVTCNQCGKNIAVKGEVLQEDILYVEKCWGYFSAKDGKKHRWNLCESCYDRFVQGFVIPIEEIDMTELL